MSSGSESPAMRLKFNQDFGCFTCCTENGLKIFNIEPLNVKQFLKKSAIGSVSQCEMLDRTNLIAMVGGSENPLYADNTVLIWNDNQEKFVMEYRFPSSVLNVLLRPDKMFVVLRNSISVFSFPNSSTKLFRIKTCDNIRGLCEVSPATNRKNQLLVCPTFNPNFRDYPGGVAIVDLRMRKLRTIVNAHQNAIACIALNQLSTMLATASTNGTLIRIHDTRYRTVLHEFRRGSASANINCINFKAESDFVCCSSDNGTVHVFALNDHHLNRKSTLSMLGVPGTYVSSQWSRASFTVSAGCRCICAFGPSNSVYAVCDDGTFHHYTIESDGSCTKVELARLSELCDESDW